MPAPFEWTEEAMQKLCDDIASGLSIREAAKKKGAPSEATIYRRMASDKKFAAMMAAAREAQQDAEVEKCVQMADRATPDNWQVVKLRIWARQWRAAKLAPHKYGDKQHIEHSGSIGLEALVAGEEE